MIHERSRQVEKFPKCSVVHERERELGRETWPREPDSDIWSRFAFAVLSHGLVESFPTVDSRTLLPFSRLVESFRAVDLRTAEKVGRPMGYGAHSQPHATAMAKERFTWGPTKWSNLIGQEG